MERVGRLSGARTTQSSKETTAAPPSGRPSPTHWTHDPTILRCPTPLPSTQGSSDREIARSLT
eukprot:4434467-Pyramimonas_sp.AAC.1